MMPLRSFGAQDFAGEGHAMLKIVSGGQTGVDRAAFDVAIERGIAYGGWCPKGGWAEDMPNPPGLLAIYDRLRETPEASPRQRTEWNVRDSDRLMVLVDSGGASASKGTELALACAKMLGRPHLVIDLDADGAVTRAATWLGGAQGQLTLCIAGPRESEAPGIYAKARDFLRVVLDRV
ncbi:MAG: putative molybdenum carrier protein [Methyloceanibacter sp.]